MKTDLLDVPIIKNIFEKFGLIDRGSDMLQYFAAWIIRHPRPPFATTEHPDLVEVRDGLVAEFAFVKSHVLDDLRIVVLPEPHVLPIKNLFAFAVRAGDPELENPPALLQLLPDVPAGCCRCRCIHDLPVREV